MSEWRLILDGAARGAWNMAVDEAILLSHAQHDAPPTLRFYSWEPFCLSLGRLQKQLPPAALDAQRDFDLVRRPTGGRAVWHAREITYCIVVRQEWLPSASRSVEGAYRWLSEGFLRGLRALGLPVEMAPLGVRTNGSNCFAASASCDFVAQGKKLIGAAQFRRDDAILQHGSLLLSIDENQWRHFAGGPMDAATSLEALGCTAPTQTVVAALAKGFAEVAGGNWGQGGLSEGELEVAQTLFREKYSRASWTFEAQVAPQQGQGPKIA